MIKAVFFDLDNVLVDAADIHYHSLNKALGFEIPYSEHLKRFNGLPTKKKLDILASERRISVENIDKIWKDKQNNTEFYVSDLKYDFSKIALLLAIKEMNIKIAVVTNAIEKTAKLMLEKTGLLQYVDLLVTNDMGLKNKPEPDQYAFAASSFCIHKEECIVVEDSDTGVKAAKSFGGHLIVVKNPSEVNSDTILPLINLYSKFSQ